MKISWVKFYFIHLQLRQQKKNLPANLMKKKSMSHPNQKRKFLSKKDQNMKSSKNNLRIV